MTPLVSSLNGPGTKMSSSIPESHIKVYDSEESIRKKIKNAYCPIGVIEDNFVLQIAKLLIFPSENRLVVQRDEKFGGDVEIDTYAHLETLFKEKSLHPVDLKNAIADFLVRRLIRVREYFDKHTDLLKELGEEFLP